MLDAAKKMPRFFEYARALEGLHLTVREDAHHYKIWGQIVMEICNDSVICGHFHDFFQLSPK